MIKVNLASNLAAGGSGSGSAEDMFVELSAAEIQRQGLIRLFILLIGPVALYLWQLQNIPFKQSQENQKQQQYQALVDKNNKAKTAIEEIERFKGSQSKLERQISTIDNLRKDRMREVRLLDLIQKEIPTKLWISKIEYKTGNLILNGLAGSDPEITSLMDSLAKSIFIKEVNLIKTSEKTLEGQTLKEFSINCVINAPEVGRAAKGGA